jgi:hypothetical protein
MLKTVGELVAAISQLINSAEASVVFAAHPRCNLITMGGFLNHLKYAVSRGVHVRGVLDISLQNLSTGREHLEGGIELRHSNLYRGMTLAVADGKRSVSLIHDALKAALSLDENVAALWSNSVTQAKFLTSAFEMAWGQASGADERINQLLPRVPPAIRVRRNLEPRLQFDIDTAAEFFQPKMNPEALVAGPSSTTVVRVPSKTNRRLLPTRDLAQQSANRV